MKKILLTLAASLIFAAVVAGQSREIKLESSSDYSQFSIPSKAMTISLEGVGSNDAFTGLFFKISVNNNSEGGFLFKDSFYISGTFGSLNPIAMTIDGKEWKLGEAFQYGKGNKGRSANVVLFFNRIPAGVTKISYCIPDYISWDNIPVDGNPDPVTHSNWTEQSLREHWGSNGCSNIEGIYYFTTTSDKNWWGSNKHTLAVIKDGYQYNVIYIK